MRADWPQNVLEKLESNLLHQLAPDVRLMFSKFTIDNGLQSSLMAYAEQFRASALETACRWMQSPKGRAIWERWLPDRSMCNEGAYYRVDTATNSSGQCADCLPGFYSDVFGSATACKACPVGTLHSRHSAACS